MLKMKSQIVRRWCTTMAGLHTEITRLRAALQEKEALLKSVEQEHPSEAPPAGEPFFSVPDCNHMFCTSPLVQSQGFTNTKWCNIADLSPVMEGETVNVRARISTLRAGKVVFMVLRQKTHTLQGVLKVDVEQGIDKDCLKWVASLPSESIVDVTGTVVVPGKPVLGCSKSEVELKLSKVHLISASKPILPFMVADAAGTTDINVQLPTRLNTRWLDMRTPANNAIWSLQSAVCRYFREFLQTEAFTEIHTPKIISTASEGGSSVFKLEYFKGKDAFLAQSPQLYKQMALQGDLMRVFEIGPLFRAEDSNTHRHLCEFVGLDVEMEIKEHYYEVLNMAEGLFDYIFSMLRTQCQDWIEKVAVQWGHEPFVHQVDEATISSLKLGCIESGRESEDTYKASVSKRNMLRLSYPLAVELLNTTLEEKMGPFEDLSTTNEKILGKLVKKRYGVDFFILDQFPLELRPFYTMPHPTLAGRSNSYDMFIRGEEISSGAQRVHDPQLLLQRAKDLGRDISQISDYIDSFKLGAWPHGGFGVGLERVVMLYLGVPNIRLCSMFPRDPQRTTP